jgi:excisionase family DNA binding protein
MQKDVLTVREVAQRLDIGLSSAYAIVKDGTVPSMKIGRKYLVPRIQFERWLQGESGEEFPLQGRVEREVAV